MKKKEITEKLLTEVELELMNILWGIGEGSVADVIEKLPKERDLAYTSVSTILRILEQKKILKARKEGRGHIYIPVLLKPDYETKTLKHVVDKVFNGTPMSVVKQLLGNSQLNSTEIIELKNLLSQLEKKK